MPYHNKVIWITGASSGIGEQLAYALNQQGARLILSARSQDKLEKVARQLADQSLAAHILPFDLENLGQLPEVAQKAWNCEGHIDILINNAGVAVRDYALSTDIALDQKLMAINYFGPVLLTKNILPQMIERGRGQLVVISSLSGKYGVPRTASYAASKHALHGFFETLRSEIIGTDIPITIIVPGIIRTDITAHAYLGDGKKKGKVETTFKTAYPAGKAATRMLRIIEKKREEAFVGGNEGITLVLNRISPWLLRRLIRNHPIKRLRKFKQLFKKNKTPLTLKKHQS